MPALSRTHIKAADVVLSLVLHNVASSTQQFFCVGSRCESLQGLRKPLLELHIEGGTILNFFGLWIALPHVRDQRGDLHRVVYRPHLCG